MKWTLDSICLILTECNGNAQCVWELLDVESSHRGEQWNKKGSASNLWIFFFNLVTILYPFFILYSFLDNYQTSFSWLCFFAWRVSRNFSGFSGFWYHFPLVFFVSHSHPVNRWQTWPGSDFGLPFFWILDMQAPKNTQSFPVCGRASWIFFESSLGPVRGCVVPGHLRAS